MKPVWRVVWCGSLLALGTAVALAQSVISARSGLIHYIEGSVFVGDQLVENKFGNFPEVKENMVLRTEAGRAEVLLTPGVFLRVGEDSSFRMITNRLIDTRLVFLSGSAVVEADDILKDNAVTVVYRDAAIRLVKKGLYRLDSEPARLRVFDGEAQVEAAGKILEVKDSRQLNFDGEMALEKFDKNDSDTLNRWSRRRAEYLSMANISAAKSVRDSGTTWASSAWAWNPYFGMFTFIPMRGSYYSPYGFRFWSPFDVYRVYMPRPVYTGYSGYNAGLGYGAVPHTSSGYSGTIASSAGSVHAPTSAAAGAASAPVSRSGGGAGGAHR